MWRGSRRVAGAAEDAVVAHGEPFVMDRLAAAQGSVKHLDRIAEPESDTDLE
jgi:hypothetical protein